MELKRLKTGQVITLHAESIIGMGGEARIYALHEAPSLVAKVYRNPTPARARKLQCMLEDPPEDPMAGSGHIMIAWPVDLLCTTDPQEDIVGFLMPRVTGLHPISSYCNPRWRRQVCPLFDWRYLHRTACNTAIAFRALHRRGYVVADVNERNIFAGDHALVTLVDTDSFQVPDRARGHILRCPVGTTEFTPRELQGVRFDQVNRLPEHDLFGLGVLIFRLLMEGTHPFEGLYLGEGEPAPYEDRIGRGHFPYGGNAQVPYRPKPLAPPFDLLHPELRQLFLQCFVDGHDKPDARPSAETWRTALERAMNTLRQCPASPQHFHGEHQDRCPWCARKAALGGRDPFPDAQTIAEEQLKPRPFAAPPSPIPQAPPPAPRPAPATPAGPLARLARSSIVRVTLAVGLIVAVHQVSQRRQPSVPTPAAVAGTMPADPAKGPPPAENWASAIEQADTYLLENFAPAEFDQAKSLARDASGKIGAEEAAAFALAEHRLARAGALARARYDTQRIIHLLYLAAASRDRFALDGIAAALSRLDLPFNPADRIRAAAAQIPGPDRELLIDLGDGEKLEFIPVRPGTFTMGSAGGDDSERPPHEVKLTRPFYLSKFEVTQEQWESVLRTNPSAFQPASGNPVERVSWDDCRIFLGKLRPSITGLRPEFPAEAQWEFACRAGSTTAYSFGDDRQALSKHAWFGQQPPRPQPIGRRQPNPWGFYDMHGNVWEWCADIDAPYPRGPVVDPPGTRVDPAGTASGKRIVRGGAWCESPQDCRSTSRRALPPNTRANSVGLRVCLNF